jgi:hypothetical protein
VQVRLQVRVQAGQPSSSVGQRGGSQLSMLQQREEFGNSGEMP